MAPVVSKKVTKTKKPSILVVDDEPALMELMGDVLARQFDCELIPAASIQEAKRILGEQAIQLLVTDVYLPDGDGTTLLAALRSRQPEAGAIVVTGAPSVDGAITALRHGAADFLPKPFSAQHLCDRVGLALKRQAALAKHSRRLKRLRDAVRRLNDARRLVSKKVDLLCNDLINAYGELSKQLDAVRTQENFRKLLGEARDLEQMLCHAMDWMLRQLGYSNVALWLAGEGSDFQLGAYMKYTIAGEPQLTDAMKEGLLPLVVREGFVNLSDEQARQRLTEAELEHLDGQTIAAVNCSYLGDALAVIVLFRDGSQSYSEEDAAILQAIGPIFATSLAGMVRESENTEGGLDYAGGEDEDEARGADWWKRGEEPPF